MHTEKYRCTLFTVTITTADSNSIINSRWQATKVLYRRLQPSNAHATNSICAVSDVSQKRRNLVRLGRSRPSNICYVVPLLPLRRIDNTDIVQCEHSFRPDGMIFRSLLCFFFIRCWSLTPAFHLQNYYLMRN